MVTVSEQIQEIYIGLLGRAADKEGLDYWTNEITTGILTLEQLRANIVNEQPEYAAGLGSMTRAQVVNELYDRLFERSAEAEGLDYWVNGEGATVNVDMLVLALSNGASAADRLVLDNKTDAAEYYTANTTDYTADSAQAAVDSVDGTLASVTASKAATDGNDQGFTLTNGSDVATANVFNADMTYTPDGSDRILSLQDEDELTGLADRTDNTLNAEIGHTNSDEGTSQLVTPELNNIQTVNLEWTGDTTTVDLRYADDVQNLNINKITADATGVTVDNITTPAANLRVADAADAATTVDFNYQRGVLANDESATLELDNVLADSVTQDALSTGARVEGFETVNLNAVNGVDIDKLSVNEMETLNITGSDYLDIVKLDASTGAGAGKPTEFMKLGAPGIANPAAVGLTTLDASAFTGDLTLDITNALGGFDDPSNSGATVHTTVTGGTGNDTFWSAAQVGATSATNRDVIDGGDGSNVLKTTAGVDGNASISNVQTLELRQQAGAQTVDFTAFDATLANVLLRGEKLGASTFNLNELNADQAVSGNISLHHGITGATAPTVNAQLTDATGSDDTVAITVENDLNTDQQFDYTLAAVGKDTDKKANGVKGDVDTVENISITDNDTESNVATLTNVADHTGTVTLAGGVAGDEYTVEGTLVAKTVEASAQNSDLTLTVGKEDQTINLGTGDDLLTFDGADTFNGDDTITDAGGVDTMRAAFSKDVTGAPSLAGLEKLHIIASANAELDMANATDLTELAILSDKAVDRANEIFSAPVSNSINAEITLKNTKLDTLNFFGDADGNRTDGGDGNQDNDSGSYTQTFNAVTLDNNSQSTVDVVISAPLENGTDSVVSGDDHGDGIQAYNLGQLTTHGVTDLSIDVQNEYSEDGVTVKADDALTTINNIWDRDLQTLTLSAEGSVDIGTVTGNTTNNNITLFDASAVGGNTSAVVKALGNDAVVNLAAGDDVFDGLGSNGTNVTINAGNGENTVTGTAQADTITSGTGNDTIHADRGNNTVTTGAGNDTVTALNGSNTVDLGSGKADKATFIYDNAVKMDAETNVIAGSGTSATIEFDADADGIIDTTYGYAVGEGAEMSLKFTGTEFDSTASTLNGRDAENIDTDAAGTIAANQSNLLVLTGSTVQTATLNGGSAADSFIDLRDGAANVSAYDVNAGDGNDAIVIAQTNTGAHTINGGEGADRIMLSNALNTAGERDIIEILDGESTVAGWDMITNFTGSDRLDLTNVATATAVTNEDGTDVGSGANQITQHSITAGGLVTFDNDDGAVTITSSNLDNVFSYLTTELNNTGETVTFAYDSEGSQDSTFIFQDGTNDTVVELTDVTDVTGIITAGGLLGVSNTGGTGPTTPTYALTGNSNSAAEGTVASFTLNTTNVDDGEEVEYTISGVEAADIVGPLNRVVEVNDGTATINVQLVADNTTEGPETLTVTVAGQASATMAVLDTSQDGGAQVASDLNAATGPIDASAGDFVFTATQGNNTTVTIGGFDEGDTLNFTGMTEGDFNVINTDFADGQFDVVVGDVTVTLTGLSAAQDLVSNAASFQAMYTVDPLTFA